MNFFENKNEIYMRQAMDLAVQAASQAETPVGALIVRGQEVISQAFNRRETHHRPTGHAEILAIEEAAQKLGNWRLEKTRLYVTLEPCLMCWGAIVLARIPEVVFGALDPKAGVCGSILSLHESGLFNHHPKVVSGVLGKECGALLTKFFSKLRLEKRLREDSEPFKGLDSVKSSSFSL